MPPIEVTLNDNVLAQLGFKVNNGLLTKTISIPSGQTESLTLSYKVSWPKDKKIRETRKIQNRIH